MALFRGLALREIPLGVPFERALEFISWGPIETWAAWDDCGGLEPVGKRILLGYNSVMTSWETSSMLFRLQLVEMS